MNLFNYRCMKLAAPRCEVSNQIFNELIDLKNLFIN